MAFVTATTNKGASNTSPNVAYPASIAANDILTILLSHDDTGATPSWAGFTSLGTQQATFDGQTYQVLYKRATGSESGTLTAGAVTAGDWAIAMLRHSDRDTANPPALGAFTVNNTGSNATTINTTATGVTALAGDDLIYFCAPDANNSNMVTTETPPAGFTNRALVLPNTGAFSVVIADTEDNVAAGPTGTLSESFGSTGGSNAMAWGTVLIRIPSDAPPADNTTEPCTAGMFSPELNPQGAF